MKRFIIQISIILLLVVILPVGFYFVKQVSNLSENEEIVQRVFDKQLETILFSINQNSENIVYSWINQIDLPVGLQSDIMANVVNHLFQNNPAIRQIEFFSLYENIQLAMFKLGNEQISILPDSLLFIQLKKYAGKNYQRIESIRDNEFTNLYFVLESGNHTVACGFRVHTKTFIEQNLNPGIQQISQDRFSITVFDSASHEIFIDEDTTAIKKVSEHIQELWYFPGNFVDIGLKSATIEELVTARSKNDNYILWALMLVVFLGISFVIFSIRKEMKLAEMKAEFVSNVSHEIRTPLALISMYAETLLLNRLNNEEKKTEYLKVIFHETNRLAGMVSRILSFSKMEKNKRSYQYTSVNVNELIQEVCENFQPHFVSNLVSCSFVLSKNETTIIADREAVMESLINLIDNAIKYGKTDNKKLEIRTKWEYATLIIDVEDNGIGIPLKYQKQIFEKFYRVTQGNLAHKAKGSGLGLNIVQQIMKQHNGTIKVRSKEGEGSCFSLIFPLNKIEND